ncbi:kinetochore protein SPC24 homolog [Salvia miltiorrhiza]|uniref:kinetochore protein SPC24 homolog n=1 Tax=Salvia miltiorrhiza TaxID=226208 RepID=UPI0025ACEFCF|nr:kinetochore protein SPC24 homolog [Salvia miltiorrhiza]
MEVPPKAFKTEELINYSNNLIDVLKEEKDTANLRHFLLQASALQSQCDKDFTEVQKSIEDYENKIHICKQKAAAAESESAADAELDFLQKELEEEQNQERQLREELREIVNEIDDLEHKRETVEEQRRTMKKFEQDEVRAQMKLSMYASVTNTIPYLDNPSRISGHIVDREKKVVETFEFDPSTATTFDTCNSIWKMINSS